jgi:hypothetical protein
MLEKVEKGYTSGAEDEIAGKLTKAMAMAGKLTPEFIDKMDDNGARAFVKSLSDEELKYVPGPALGKLVEKMAKGYTSGEEDKLMARCAVALALSDPASFTPEVAKNLDDNGTRAMVEQMTPAQLKNLPTETLSALIKELDAGWTTGYERQMISRLNDAISQK